MAAHGAGGAGASAIGEIGVSRWLLGRLVVRGRVAALGREGLPIDVQVIFAAGANGREMGVNEWLSR